jgi:8-oxo-dGTP pyrophosphatase MutT (NUDIX family)
MNEDYVDLEKQISLSNLVTTLDDINIIEKKKIILYCSNCGKVGHIYKKCKDPITSLGIILFNLNNSNLNIEDKLENKYIYKNIFSRYKNSKYIFKKIYLNRFNDKNNLLLENQFTFNKIEKLHEDYNLFDTPLTLFDNYRDIIKQNIKFLMIQRKFSVGFIEFIRGKYDENNNEYLIFLLNQMTPYEIKNIEEKDFDHLWNLLWNNKYSNIPLNVRSFDDLDKYDLTYNEKKIYLKVHLKEYNISKKKFIYLKENNIITNLITIVEPKFNEPEWGFPKGRRNIHEKPLDCALREFEEETNIDRNNIKIFDRINPINECFIGTNKINYKHTYYLGYMGTCLSTNVETESQLIEIGNIGWFTYEEAINIIRPYHKNRINIINDIINFLAYNLKYYTHKNMMI